MLLPLDGTDSKIIKEYQTLVGCLIWLLKTRPDLSFLINLLCRFLKAPTKAHLNYALGRPLRYLKQTMTVGVVFCHQGKWELSGASDADLAGDLVSSRSTTGHYLKLGEWGTIISQSRLERKVCDSTGMSETYAMKDLVHQTVWTRALLDELGIPMTEPTELSTDNDGVLKQSTKTVNHTTAKHYRIAQAYIREEVRDSPWPSWGSTLPRMLLTCSPRLSMHHCSNVTSTPLWDLSKLPLQLNHDCVSEGKYRRFNH